MKKLIERLRTPTNRFWKLIYSGSLGIALATTAGAIFANPSYFPAWVNMVAPHIMTASIVASFLAKLTKEEE